MPAVLEKVLDLYGNLFAAWLNIRYPVWTLNCTSAGDLEYLHLSGYLNHHSGRQRRNRK